MAKIVDITGKRFNKLTVLEFEGTDKYNNAVWKCMCECGNISYVRGCSLRRGDIKSCGCIGRGEKA